MRRSILAGTWYPADAETLRAQVDADLEAAATVDAVRQARATGRRVRALVLPHAGLQWSGPTAALGCALLAGRDVRRVVIMGTAHHGRFPGVSIDLAAAYETPLGRVPLARAAVEALLEHPDLAYHRDAHAPEHSIEIELPYLQRALPEGFELVPLLVSSVTEERLGAVVAALAAIAGEETVVIASTDLTHYGASFGYQPFAPDARIEERLRELDLGAVTCLLAGDRGAFERYRAQTGITICGHQPLRVLLELLGRDAPARGALLGYTTSGALTGEFSHSVSYAAIAYLDGANDETSELDPEARRQLLELARRTIARAATAPERSDPAPVELPDDPAFAVPRAVFVTLRSGGELRGCIGTTVPLRPLGQAVAHAAWSAAFEDPRFDPVRGDELDHLRIEISVLGPLRAVRAAAEIVPGRDGVAVASGGRRAVFLPQVAAEQGWDRETLLERLALKAGLEPAAWIEGATYEVFQVQKFAESVE